MVGVYAIYGQYHADPSAEETVIYYRVPEEEIRWVISSISFHALLDFLPGGPLCLALQLLDASQFLQKKKLYFPVQINVVNQQVFFLVGMFSKISWWNSVDCT